MSEVVIIAALTAKPGKEEEAEELLRSVIAPTHAEAGCIFYALHRGTDDPRRYCYVECWASRAELEAHQASPLMQAAFARVEDIFGDSRDVTFYEAVPGGDATKGSLSGAVTA